MVWNRVTSRLLAPAGGSALHASLPLCDCVNLCVSVVVCCFWSIHILSTPAMESGTVCVPGWSVHKVTTYRSSGRTNFWHVWSEIAPMFFDWFNAFVLSMKGTWTDYSKLFKWISYTFCLYLCGINWFRVRRKRYRSILINFIIYSLV